MAFELPNAGQLRQSIRFEYEVAGPNVGGVKTTSWATLIENRSAKIAPTKGGSEVISGRLQGKVMYDIWVSSDSQTRALTIKHRAVNNRTGEVYALGTPIDPNERRQWLLIQAVSNGKVATP